MKDSTEKDISTSVEKKIKSFARGDLEHATETLSALWEIVNTGGDIRISLDARSTVSYVPTLPFF